MFTSLIVQIKPPIKECAALYFNVYIPHSSDKTILMLSQVALKKKVYIPHSSDKTIRVRYTNRRYTIVYIPHSSDKTH